MNSITKIYLENFKCFDKGYSFPLSRFNLLTGINGQGKSTLLQSLLLMNQTTEYNLMSDQLILNGENVKIGSIEDLKNSNLPKENDTIFTFHISNGKESSIFTYKMNRCVDDLFRANIESLTVNGNVYSTEPIKQTRSKLYQQSKSEYIGRLLMQQSIDDAIDLTRLFTEIHYIAADRIGPQNFYEKKTLPCFIRTGPRGENVVNVIHQKELELFNVNDALYLGKDAKTMEQQTEEWLRNILGNVTISIKGKEPDSSVLTLLLGKSGDTRKYKAANTGFGFTYVLPIIVSGLIAQPGQILIIENPEAHLHPRAQFRLMQFLVKVAMTGVTIFVETHSDHILNSLRVAVNQKASAIMKDNVSILYFQDKDEDFVLPIPLQEDGSITDWPGGFFDQSEKDLEVLVGF